VQASAAALRASSGGQQQNPARQLLAVAHAIQRTIGAVHGNGAPSNGLSVDTAAIIPLILGSAKQTALAFRRRLCQKLSPSPALSQICAGGQLHLFPHPSVFPSEIIRVPPCQSPAGSDNPSPARL
jgi:hypothetical protein